jgi:parallel beta-helix repeat protein
MRSFLLLVSILIAAPAIAAEGVVEINQACAVNMGCFSGDGPGLPVTISTSGSYRLTGNLSVPVDTNGIEITVNDVTMDLNGFVISGSGGVGGDGVSAANRGSITVKDGVVKTMGGNGVLVGFQSLVQGVHAGNNSLIGIMATGPGSTITGNTAMNNSQDGIAVSGNSKVADNNALFNLAKGISTGAGCSVTGNIAEGNQSYGISTGNSSTIADNIVTTNQSDGINASSISTITGNTANSNVGSGIKVASGGVVMGNIAAGNGSWGLNLGVSSGFRDNVVSGNNNGSIDPGEQVFLGIQMGTNLCNFGGCP